MSNNCHEITGYKLSPIITGVKLSPIIYAAKLSPIVEGIGCADDFTPITYIFDDRFAPPPTQAPPLAGARTTEPGGQAVTITDSNDIFSISGGELLFPADAAIITTDPIYQSDDQFTPETAWAFSATLTSVSPTPKWRVTAGSVGFFGANATTQLITGGNNSQPVINVVNDTEYTFCAIQRSEGGFYFIILYSGTWRLMGATPTGATGGMAAVLLESTQNTRANADISSLKITIMPAPFDQSYGLATFTDLGAVSVQSFTHEADFVLTCTVNTAPTAGQIEINFRIQDANNYWQLAITNTQYQLWEYAAGAGTLRGSSSTVAGSPAFSIGCLDETITLWSGTISLGARRVYYTSAANFKTETSGEIVTLGTGGALDNFAVFKSDLSEYANILSRLE